MVIVKLTYIGGLLQQVHQADELLEVGMGEDCKVVVDPRFSKCKLSLKGFPNEVYDVEWDLIMVDAPTGYHDEAPGRMGAIYTAGWWLGIGKMVRLMCLCMMWIGWWRTSFPRHFCVRATLGNKKAGLGILPFQAIGLDPEDPFAHEKWGPLPVWKLLFQQIQWHGMQVFTKLQAFMHWVLWKTLFRLLIQ